MRLLQGSRVLDRGDGTLQVGVRAPVVLAHLTYDERRFVERLETARTISSRDRTRFASLVAILESGGALELDAPSAPSPTVAINDAGPLGLGVALALARSGWAIRFVDEGPAAASPPDTYAPGGLASTRQAAAADTVTRAIPGADVRVGAPAADAWVLVSHGAAALDVAAGLMAGDVPHLFVVTDELGAEVGPFVVPGDGACGMCAGYARATADPAWPLLALQLRVPSVAPPKASADVVASAVGIAGGALAAWRASSADRGATGAWLNRSWVIAAGVPPVTRDLVPAVDCGCGAAGPVGDEVAARRARFPGA